MRKSLYIAAVALLSLALISWFINYLNELNVGVTNFEPFFFGSLFVLFIIIDVIGILVLALNKRINGTALISITVVSAVVAFSIVEILNIALLHDSLKSGLYK